jgi:hypothetical protein
MKRHIARVTKHWEDNFHTYLAGVLWTTFCVAFAGLLLRAGQ